MIAIIGRSGLSLPIWLWLVLIIGAGIVSLLVSRQDAGTSSPAGSGPASRDEDRRVCPFCAETIKAAAIVCRYCGRDVPPEPPGLDFDASARHVSLPRNRVTIEPNELVQALNSGLYLKTAIDAQRLWEIAEGVSRGLPPQREGLMKLHFGTWTAQADGQKVFGIGVLKGNGALSEVRWSFTARAVSGGFHIVPTHLATMNGALRSDRALSKFLNAAMDAILRTDHAAEITLLAETG